MLLRRFSIVFSIVAFAMDARAFLPKPSEIDKIIPETKKLCLLLGFCSTVSAFQFRPGEAPNVLTTLFEWNQLDFEYQNAADRQRDIDSGFFVPGIPAIIDADVFYSREKSNRVFVTIPRFRNGSPISLGEVTYDQYRGNHLIRPFPSWSWHRNPTQCQRNRLISVYRIQIDKCGRLWVLDNGRLGNNLICPPQILAFDLIANELVQRYELPSSQYESRSIFVTPIVDVRDTCSDVFVYAADCQTYALVVYDVRRGRSWRIIDKTMYPHPNFGTYTILEDSFDLMDGILGMSLSPYARGRDRKLFFHAMSSDTENWAYVSDLRNESRFLNNPQSSPQIFHTFRGRRVSQSAAEAIDAQGILYFGDMTSITLNCWDTTRASSGAADGDYEYNVRNFRILSNDTRTMQFASGVKVIDNRTGGQELYVVTSRFQKIGANTQNTNEINFRIMAAKIDENVVRRCKTYRNDNPIGGGYGFGSSPFNNF